MSVVRQSAIILALGWLLAPLQFLVSVMVARAVGPQGKGMLALLAGVTAVLTSLASLGVASGASALYRQNRFERREVIGSAVWLTAAASCLLLLAFALGGQTLIRLVVGDEGARIDRLWLALALAAVPVSALAAVGDVVLIAENAMRVYAVRAVAAGLLAVGLTWLFVFQWDLGITGVLVSQPLAAVAGLGLLAGWLTTREELRRLRISRAACSSLLHIGLQQHAIGIIALIAKRVDVFLIASFLSIRDAGFYSVAILLSNVFMSIPRATMWPLVGAFSAGSQDDPRMLARASRVQVLFMALLTLALMPLAPLLVHVAFGDAFSPAVAPLRWALAGVFVTPVTISVNAYLTARGRPGLSIVSALVGTGIQIAVTLLFIRRWGTIASAAALSANYVSTAAVQLLIVRRERVIDFRGMLIPTVQDLRDARSLLLTRVRRSSA